MRGLGALGVIIAMGIVAVLVMLYMRTSMPTGNEMRGHRTAIDGAKKRAAEVETQQQERIDQMQRSLAGPGTP